MRSQIKLAARLVAACALLVITLAQLFTFDEFPSVLSRIGLFDGESTAAIVATILVVAEVFALPILLDIKMSTQARRASLAAAIVAAAMLTVLELAAWMSGMTIVLGEFGF